MIRNLIKLTNTVASLTACFLCLGANAAVKTYENTWFEIEVILFSQLGDKNQLQEAFPETSNIPTPTKIIDLLGPYLDPNIANLKSRLPLCNNYLPESDNNFSTKAFKVNYNPIDTKLTAKYLSNLLLVNGLTFNDIYKNAFNNKLTTEPTTTLDENVQQGQQLNLQQKNSYTQNGNLEGNNTFNSRPPITNENVIFTEVETSTKLENENTVNEYIFTTFNVPQKFCSIPESFFNEYKQENPHFSYNDVPLTNTPLIISGEEDFTTNKPYLISQESLQLQDIVKQLKRSRNFRPLMHMGWRQITKLKKDAIPLKLYAGENLMQPYYEAILQYNNQQKQLTTEQALINQSLMSQALIEQEQENLNSNALTASVNPTQNDIALRNQQEVLKNKITDILQQAKNAQYTLESVLNNVDSNATDIVTPLTQEKTREETQENGNKLMLPQMPPQPWTIDGFLKVEVGHFLHVTADFNIVNMSLGEQATKQLVNSEQIPLKSIRFEQNKRVRSKEIHYFDHPYMGIIVQIRRHEQVPPIEENDDELLIDPSL